MGISLVPEKGTQQLPYHVNQPVTIALYYWPDWVAVVVMGMLVRAAIGMDRNTDRFFDQADPAFNYPYLESTVSDDDLFLWFGVMPMAVCVTLNAALFFFKRSWLWALDFHHFGLGFAISFLTAQLCTIVLKAVVGRVRPSGVQRNFGHGWNESYPSAHTTTAFLGSVYLALYLTGKCGTFRHSGLLLRRGKADGFAGSFLVVVVTVLPNLALALYVMATRLTDYAHDFSDVNFSVLIGSVASIIGYFTVFPALSNDFCHMARPLARLEGVNEPVATVSNAAALVQ